LAKGQGVRTTEDSTLLILLIAVSLAFAWILWPFYGAILWAMVFATVFAPTHRRVLATMRQSPNMAALTTLLLIVAIALAAEMQLLRRCWKPESYHAAPSAAW
jgi:predicted PurR-regulated permease PerM